MSQQQPIRRQPLKGTRRIAITVTLDADTHAGLFLIGNGNRSAAIEYLVRQHLSKREQTRQPDFERLSESVS